MKYVLVHIWSQSASFRHPDFQNFHKSLPLPPPTTMMGIAGAALGFGPLKTQEFFLTDETRLGIWGESQGLMKDLWKYSQKAHKYNEDAFLIDPKAVGILQREALMYNEFVLLYAMTDEQKLQNLFEAFHNPVFVITMGNSDSLAKIKNCHLGEETSLQKNVSNCLVEGDVVEQVLARSKENPEFRLGISSDPISFDLPVRFNYEKEYGRRSIASRKTYSFIGPDIKINYQLDCASYTGVGSILQQEKYIHIPLIAI